MDVFEGIVQLLEAQQIAYRHVHHAPTRTSEESAQARGEELRTGGKALVIRVGEQFRLFVLSAACQLDTGAIKTHFGAKKTRFATPEELVELTGLVPGSVPPFGEPILPLPLFVDESIIANPRIAFNAGRLTDSIILATADYLRIARHERLSFSRA